MSLRPSWESGTVLKFVDSYSYPVPDNDPHVFHMGDRVIVMWKADFPYFINRYSGRMDYFWIVSYWGQEFSIPGFSLDLHTQIISKENHGR